MTSLYVNVYVGQTRAAKWIRRLEEMGWGEMVCRGELPPRRQPWAYDNGAFKDWKAGKPFDESKFLADLDWIHLHAKTLPDFIVCPDIVAGGLESLRFSLEWANKPQLRALKAPLYLAVQDGMSPDDVALALRHYDFTGVFVGGSLPWKIRTAGTWVLFAHAKGLKCHVGRVGTRRRVQWAIRIEADSIDSCLPLWSEENLTPQPGVGG